ncbi:MAG: class I SAM-dependent methyltransferase [Pseudorhodoplanes sp.]|uniref:class I SAM-dependent methyltransferase n=1 Tax=Pseudorhodoplanes sp. TaxID=1934341 RepID=UPI003D0DAE1B
MSETSRLFTDGEAYEQVMGRWSRMVGERFLDWLDVPTGMRWVDIGCGNGAFTELIVARCAPSSIFGFDPSSGQIAFARTRPGAQQADYQVAGAEALPLADDSADAAVMALVISFVTNPAKAIAEMARVTRPGGWVATYMWDLERDGVPTFHIHAAAKSLGISTGSLPNTVVARQEVMRDLWQTAGLVSVETMVIRIPVRHESFEDYWAIQSLPVGPAGRLIQTMSPDQTEQLRTRLREIMPIAADGSIAFEAVANAIKGRVP